MSSNVLIGEPESRFDGPVYDFHQDGIRVTARETFYEFFKSDILKISVKKRLLNKWRGSGGLKIYKMVWDQNDRFRYIECNTLEKGLNQTGIMIRQKRQVNRYTNRAIRMESRIVMVMEG